MNHKYCEPKIFSDSIFTNSYDIIFFISLLGSYVKIHFFELSLGRKEAAAD